MESQTAVSLSELTQWGNPLGNPVGNPLGNVYTLDFDEEKINLLRRTIARGASEDELSLFVEQCRRTGLDPFARQIYAVRRKQWNAQSHGYEEAQVIQVSIDGFRLIADRTHKYAGQVGPWWCGADGEWKEVWLTDTAPAAARVGVMRHDFQQPLFAVALFKSYVQTNSQGEPISRWKTDPAGMIAKCAESLALRRAFPHELSGLYTTEEMGQADNPASAHAAIHAENTPATEILNAANGAAAVSNGYANGIIHAAHVKQPLTRPYTPAELQANFHKAVAAIEARGLLLGPEDYLITEAAFTPLLADEADRRAYLVFLTGKEELEELDESQVVALMRLLKPTQLGDQQDAAWLPCDEARAEAEAVIAAQ